MGRKKKDEMEMSCANCANGPEPSDDCETCEGMDQWSPKGPSCDGDSCTVSVNGGPTVPFPSAEATEQVTEMVEKHLENDGLIKAAKDGLNELQAIRKKHNQQLDLEGKPAEYPVDVESEDYTVLTFECGSWSLKVREDRLEGAAACNNITALVQRRLKAGSELYPLSEGEFDRWVQRFTKSLTNYVRTGCA